MIIPLMTMCYLHPSSRVKLENEGKKEKKKKGFTAHAVFFFFFTAVKVDVSLCSSNKVEAVRNE